MEDASPINQMAYAPHFGSRRAIERRLERLQCSGLNLVGKNKAEVDGRRMTLLDMVLCPSEYATRQQVRAKYSMEFSYWMDALVIALCCPLAMCQDARELSIRKKALQAMYRPATLDME
eukprot:GGOE01022309.1.p2 GENE.GGOE01022309.1~~GGOE01022309.1.p2  ORF type:complete len:119 (+),score=38.72 GGOE01022309.1:89-445(+)